mgnify:CR=1 FL=1
MTAIASMTLGNAVEVVNSDGKRIPAKLDYVSQSVTPDLGTRQMRAKITSPANILSGQFVRVRIQTGTEHAVYKVPQASVLQLSDGTYAVYLREGNKAKRVPVEVGPWDDTDHVITDQILRLRDGREVTDPGKGSPAASRAAS